jgi:hypothetical protein
MPTTNVKRKKIIVYVVNHRNEKFSSVEVFQYKDRGERKLLIHLRTVKNRLFGQLRDLCMLII